MSPISRQDPLIAFPHCPLNSEIFSDVWLLKSFCAFCRRIRLVALLQTQSSETRRATITTFYRSSVVIFTQSRQHLLCHALRNSCPSDYLFAPPLAICLKLQRIVFAYTKTLQPLSQYFWRAMLCKRGLCCRAVSVCPSVTFVNSVKTSNHIFKKI